MSLYCVLCMYSPKGGKAKSAVTIIQGYAVCDDHMGYVAQGSEWYFLYRAVQNQERSARPSPSGESEAGR